MNHFDFSSVMSAYVQFHTEDPGDGSWIPMTVKEAEKEFLGFVRDLQAKAWDEGAIARGVSGDYYTTNPYRSSE